ncbi:MAG: nitrate- and nitrite sensing domain-containing protein, partial [Leptothrix sp. (in: b-proteobacteria)]
MFKLANLSITRKFLLLGAFAAAAALPPSIGLVRDRIAIEAAARDEVAGLAPTSAMLKLLRLTQQHRGTSGAVLSGNSAMQAKREALQADVDAALAAAVTALQPFTQTHTEADADITRPRDAVQAEWTQLPKDVASRSATVPESFRRHTALIANQLDLINGVLDASGLTLDPEAASYHLLMGVLQDLPQVTEGLGQLRALGTAALTQHDLTPAQRAAVLSAASAARGHAATARTHLAKA